MRVEVIEFDVECPTHGHDRVVVEACMPRPHRCSRCARPLTARVPLQRYNTDLPVPSGVGPEAFLG
jgi:hypothetical protein